jgi:rRNA biogenesis protein RRP5
MAFHVGITELEKARSVAEQALNTINYREQQEKWNVWIALMNLENLYGTAESLKKVFDRAKERNDAKKITMELCKMFEASEKLPLAEEAFEAALKHFGQSGKVWYNYALFYYRRKDLDKARAILPRALERLVKRKHLKLIRKMAQAEYTLGTPERGRTIMEGVMSSYPKRVDLWSTYLDMEIKAGKAASFPANVLAIVRRLFERIVYLDLKPRKMKFFFKRYLSFEKEQGDASSQHHVKELAQSYVDKVIKAT